jgi:hypothetical protein
MTRPRGLSSIAPTNQRLSERMNQLDSIRLELEDLARDERA